MTWRSWSYSYLLRLPLGISTMTSMVRSVLTSDAFRHRAGPPHCDPPSDHSPTGPIEPAQVPGRGRWAGCYRCPMSVETIRGPADGTGPDSGQRYFARQLSDLDFNDRLLDLVADRDIPLLERVKFLVLFSERIDEFFQVQVAGLRRQVVAGIKSLALNGSTPDQLLKDVRASLERMVRRQEALLLNELAPALRAQGIELCDWVSLGS